MVFILAQHGEAPPVNVACALVREGRYRTLPLPAGRYRAYALNAPLKTPVSIQDLWKHSTPVTLEDERTTVLDLRPLALH